MNEGNEATGFLYPFIEADERDAGPLLIDLAASAVEKGAASAALRRTTLERLGPELAAVADAVAARLTAGARLFTFGNGGSSTDAAGLAALFSHPPWGFAVPARCLVDDAAVLTALGNDVGFELVFSRQLIAHAASGDIAVAFSTSGGSRNVLKALAEARARGLLTVGLAGYDGGAMAASPDLEHCLVVRSDSVHRIQEAQAAVGFALWAAVQQRLEARDG
jgi:D-sedoheptulose 7-phosphate isomerase